MNQFFECCSNCQMAKIKIHKQISQNLSLSAFENFSFHFTTTSVKKLGPYGDLTNEAKIRLEICDISIFLRSIFFQNALKKFLLAITMIMFKVCKRCVQPCTLRQKKNDGDTISTSKYIQKS